MHVNQRFCDITGYTPEQLNALTFEQITHPDDVEKDKALYDRLIEPLMVAALNTAPPDSSALLARNIVRETLGAGGRACRPLFARDGLGTVVTPGGHHRGRSRCSRMNVAASSPRPFVATRSR